MALKVKAEDWHSCWQVSLHHDAGVVHQSESGQGD